MSAFLLGVMVIGCGQGVETSISFLPHADGYSWEYRGSLYVGTVENYAVRRIRYFDGTTTLSNDLIVQNFITSDEVITGSLSLLNTFAVPLPYDVTYCYINGTGVYDFGKPGSPTTEANLFLPLPLEIGKTWVREGVTDTFSCEVIGTETVSVSAGTFDAFKVGLSLSGTLEPIKYEWYADGVGMVKLSIEDITIYSQTGEVIGTGTYIEELVSKNF